VEVVQIAQMKNSNSEISEEFFLFASAVKPGPVQRRIALLFALGILVAFFVITGLSDNQAHPFPGFVLVFVISMLLCDLITAILLFAQFSILRSSAVLMIANGYVFTALILVGWTLSFPGAFFPDRSLIGGLQTASGFYIAWRSGFAAYVIGYALLKDTPLKDTPQSASTRQVSVGRAIGMSLASTVALVLVITLVCVQGEPFLPKIMANTLQYSPLYPVALGLSNSLLSILGLILLWRRGRSTLDLWLMVVMFFYVMDLPLSYYPAPVRFTDGWYAVRVIAFLSSTLILILLLCEITNTYAKLLTAIAGQRREREARLVTGDAIAAMIAHAVKQPLTAMINRSEIGLLWLDRSQPDLEKAKLALKNIKADGHRAGAIIERVRANFQKDIRTRAQCDVNDLIGETIALVRADLQRHQIAVKAEPNSLQPQVIADRIQLQQLFLNLVTNAIDSMAEKSGPRVLSVETQVRDDGGIVVSVADTGTGIDSHHVDHIFNPFYTTKVGGMGMGLSICRSIVDAHSGEISVSANRPEGTKFQIILNTAE
jgi:signal transduction histidine kinase